MIGREAERAFIAQTAAAGEIAGVVLVGEAGVGKSRLVLESLRDVQGQHFATARVVATRAGATIPFGPFAHLLPEASASTSSRLDLLREIGGSLSALARGRRLVLGIDDAHLLDDGSAALVHHLAVTSAAFVLVAVRAGEPAPDPIVALWKDGLTGRLEVVGLSEEQVRRLVPEVLGGQVDGPTTARLWEVTRGNVLFLRELVISGLEGGTLLQAGGVWSWKGPMGVSARLQEVVAARMGKLDSNQTALLEVLAFGEPASANFLQRLFSPAALDAAERRGMAVAEKRGRRLFVRLAHPLYGEVVRARCPALRARAVHHELAAALEAAGARRREDLLRLATSRLEAGESAPPELLLAGARRAYAFDPVLAERLARAAADAGGGIPAQYGLAKSLFGQGRFSEMESLAGGEQRVPMNDSERVMDTTRRAYALWIGSGRPDDANELLLQTEHDIGDGTLRDRLKQTRAFVLFYSGRNADAIAVLSGILDGSETTDRTRLSAAANAVLALAVSGHTEQAVAIAERWIDCAYRLAEKSPLVVGHLLTTKSYALLLAGRLHEADALATKEYRKALSQHTPETTAISAGLLGRIALVQGRVETAASWLREAAALFRSPSAFSYFPLYLSGLAYAAALRGDLATANAALAEADDIATPGMAICEPDVRLARAWVAAAGGEMSKARTVALDAADLAEEQGAYAFALPALHDVARFGDPRAVAARLRDLTSAFEGPLAEACAGHAEALAAHDGPGLDRASGAFEVMGANLLAAEAAAEAAAVYRGEDRKASMRASSARARRLLEYCEGARTPALSGLAPDPLTSREREVAMLAARGLTSAEIAGRLVLSLRTVENHLQRVYAKLGVVSRAELRLVLQSESTQSSR